MANATRIPMMMSLGLFIWCASAEAAGVEVNAFKYSDPSFESNVQVDLSGVPGVVGASVKTAGGTVQALSSYAPDHYGAWQGPWTSFAEFHTAAIGDWQLVIDLTGGDKAVYDFSVNEFGDPFTSDSFPPAPTMTSPSNGQSGVSPTPTFQWDNGGTHTGALESLYVFVASQANPAISQFESSSGGSLTLASESWTPTVVLPPGAAYYLVQYETNQDEDAKVTTPVFNISASTVADPNIPWDLSYGDLFSRDDIEFTVAPEPATLALLALGFALSLSKGGMALNRRRRA